MAWKDYESLDCSPEKIKPEERQRIIEKYPELAIACSKSPRIALHIREKAKGGFIEKFCK